MKPQKNNTDSGNCKASLSDDHETPLMHVESSQHTQQTFVYYRSGPIEHDERAATSGDPRNPSLPGTHMDNSQLSLTSNTAQSIQRSDRNATELTTLMTSLNLQEAAPVGGGAYAGSTAGEQILRQLNITPVHISGITENQRESTVNGTPVLDSNPEARIDARVENADNRLNTTDSINVASMLNPSMLARCNALHSCSNDNSSQGVTSTMNLLGRVNVITPQNSLQSYDTISLNPGSESSIRFPPTENLGSNEFENWDERSQRNFCQPMSALSSTPICPEVLNDHRSGVQIHEIEEEELRSDGTSQSSQEIQELDRLKLSPGDMQMFQGTSQQSRVGFPPQCRAMRCQQIMASSPTTSIAMSMTIAAAGSPLGQNTQTPMHSASVADHSAPVVSTSLHASLQNQAMPLPPNLQFNCNLPNGMPPSNFGQKFVNEDAKNIFHSLIPHLNSGKFEVFFEHTMTYRPQMEKDSDVYFMVRYLESCGYLYQNKPDKCREAVSDALNIVPKTSSPNKFKVDILAIQSWLQLKRKRLDHVDETISGALQTFHQDKAICSGKVAGWIHIQDARLSQTKMSGRSDDGFLRDEAISSLQFALEQFEIEIKEGMKDEGIYGYTFACLKLISILLHCDEGMKLPQAPLTENEHVKVLEHLVRLFASSQQNLDMHETNLRVALADYYLRMGNVTGSHQLIMDALRVAHDPEAKEYCQARFDHLMVVQHQGQNTAKSDYAGLLFYVDKLTEENCLKIRQLLMGILRHLKYKAPIHVTDSNDYVYMWENFVIPGTSFRENTFALDQERRKRLESQQASVGSHIARCSSEDTSSGATADNEVVQEAVQPVKSVPLNIAWPGATQTMESGLNMQIPNPHNQARPLSHNPQAYSGHQYSQTNGSQNQGPQSTSLLGQTSESSAQQQYNVQPHGQAVFANHAPAQVSSNNPPLQDQWAPSMPRGPPSNVSSFNQAQVGYDVQSQTSMQPHGLGMAPPPTSDIPSNPYTQPTPPQSQFSQLPRGVPTMQQNLQQPATTQAQGQVEYNMHQQNFPATSVSHQAQQSMANPPLVTQASSGVNVNQIHQAGSSEQYPSMPRGPLSYQSFQQHPALAKQPQESGAPFRQHGYEAPPVNPSSFNPNPAYGSTVPHAAGPPTNQSSYNLYQQPEPTIPHPAGPPTNQSSYNPYPQQVPSVPSNQPLSNLNPGQGPAQPHEVGPPTNQSSFNPYPLQGPSAPINQSSSNLKPPPPPPHSTGLSSFNSNPAPAPPHIPHSTGPSSSNPNQAPPPYIPHSTGPSSFNPPPAQGPAIGPPTDPFSLNQNQESSCSFSIIESQNFIGSDFSRQLTGSFHPTDPVNPHNVSYGGNLDLREDKLPQWPVSQSSNMYQPYHDGQYQPLNNAQPHGPQTPLVNNFQGYNAPSQQNKPQHFNPVQNQYPQHVESHPPDSTLPTLPIYANPPAQPFSHGLQFTQGPNAPHQGYSVPNQAQQVPPHQVIPGHTPTANEPVQGFHYNQPPAQGNTHPQMTRPHNTGSAPTVANTTPLVQAPLQTYGQQPAPGNVHNTQYQGQYSLVTVPQNTVGLQFSATTPAQVTTTVDQRPVQGNVNPTQYQGQYPPATVPQNTGGLQQPVQANVNATQYQGQYPPATVPQNTGGLQQPVQVNVNATQYQGQYPPATVPQNTGGLQQPVQANVSPPQYQGQQHPQMPVPQNTGGHQYFANTRANAQQVAGDAQQNVNTPRTP